MRISIRANLEALVVKDSKISKDKKISSENAAALILAMSKHIFDSKVLELLVQLGESCLSRNIVWR